MTRILLFADYGKGPRCVARILSVPPGHYASMDSVALESWRFHHIGGLICRWWLVECENAEAGRDLIARAWAGEDPARREYPLVNKGPAPIGRILDYEGVLS